MQRTRSLTIGLVVVIVGVLVLVLAVTGGSAKKTAPVAGASAINVKQTPLGKTIVDANGRTLYLFAADRPGVSTLSAAGLAVWPAFTSAGTPRAEGEAVAAKISVGAGPNGSRQVEYNGHPLYYFVGDKSAGSTSGQGLNEFGGLWYVLSASGSAVTKAPATPAPATEAPSEGGYRY